jgi:hypothetical protein
MLSLTFNIFILGGIMLSNAAKIVQKMKALHLVMKILVDDKRSSVFFHSVDGG